MAAQLKYRRHPGVPSPLVAHSEKTRFHGSAFEHNAKWRIINFLIRLDKATFKVITGRVEVNTMFENVLISS